MTDSIYLDTVGLIAAWDRSDQWHDVATAAYERIAQQGSIAITCSYVLLECGNAAARKPFRHAVDRLRVKLTSCEQLIFPTMDDWDTAWDAFRRAEAGQAGIVDQISFTVMRRLAITQAFTNDRHFQAAGFETLF